MTWTDERVSQLRQLWAEGLSCSQIASIMGGLSRNAVIGKARRLGLGPKPERTPKQRKSKSNFNFGSVWRGYPEGEPEPFVPRAADVVSRQISIMALTATTCRWPDDERSDEGQITFCGHPVKDEHPYCAAHCALAYIPRRERTEKQKEADQRLAQRHRSARSLPAKKWLAEEAA